MSRPALLHEGFLIPNAANVTNARMAEPDRVDFNTLANARWGVIEDCLVTVSGSMAQTNGGLAIVDSMLVIVQPGSVPLGVGGAQDRFDLIVVNQAGTVSAITGAPATDPVFPDVDKQHTTLAAVFCPASGSNFSDNVIDKRKLLAKALLTKIPIGDMLVQNRNGTGDEYSISGAGFMTWQGDTRLSRSAVATLRVQDHLLVDQDIHAGDDITAGGDIGATGLVTSSNLQTGTVTPGGPQLNGALFQHQTSGRLYIWRNNKWNELATIESANPVGAFLQSFEPPAKMMPLGWVPLDGRTVTEGEYPELFKIDALLAYATGTAPNRTMALPDATGRVLMGGTSAARLGGPVNNRISLLLDQMPRHEHNPILTPAGIGPISITVGRAGTHGHPIDGGEHGHNVNDPGHAHNGFDIYGGGDVVVLDWFGRNKIDAFFNDRNHTFSVSSAAWTRPAATGITISSAGSGHGHNIHQSGDHDHPVTLNAPPPHGHDIDEEYRGSNSPIDITPLHMTVFMYVRS